MRRLVVALLLACCAARGQQIYDLLLKNGRVIDPANHRDAAMDVAVAGNKIVRVAANLPVAHARVVVDVSGYMVTAGLIDINTHLAEVKPDYNMLPYGVTTAVDRGSATCETVSKVAKKFDHAKTRVLEYVAGGCGQNPGIVAGPLADGGALLLRDVRRTIPETISSGINAKNVLLPRANMSTAMSIYLNSRLTAEQIIERVTSNAARAIGRAELGTLNEGATADIAVLEIQQGKFGFLDAALARLDANRRFRCVLTVRNGSVVWDSEGLSIPDTIRAGPYTNFK